MNTRDVANRTFEEIEIGAAASAARMMTATDVEALALAAGDVDGFHIEGSDPGERLSAQGAAAVALVAALVNGRLPGPGSRIVESRIRYDGIVHIGDTLTAEVTAKAKDARERTILFDCRCTNQDGVELLRGDLTVSAPSARIAYSNVATPELILRRNDGFAQVFARCKPLAPVTCAVVHPCERTSLTGAIEAAKAGLIVPVLVGPPEKIRAAALAERLDIEAFEIVAVPHSHAAAERAVAMANAGLVDALMKGSLHTEELMSAVVASATGLRTSRRVSHVFVMDVPTYPRLLLVTDAAINILPDVAAKADICQNAIDLAHVLGIGQPKVAILSAVEIVNPKIPGTLDAAALCKMAERGQITGAILDGPLAFDNAISAEAARAKGIVSPVAGLADILLVPDLEAGNMLAKQLQYLAGADGAGIVLGARVPIVLTSRADSVRTRLASTAVLKLVAHARRERLAPRPE
jgi:phosphotransacetylase/acyl dehydratase